MPFSTVSTLKFVGTVSLGIFTVGHMQSRPLLPPSPPPSTTIYTRPRIAYITGNTVQKKKGGRRSRKTIIITIIITQSNGCNGNDRAHPTPSPRSLYQPSSPCPQHPKPGTPTSRSKKPPRCTSAHSPQSPPLPSRSPLSCPRLGSVTHTCCGPERRPCWAQLQTSCYRALCSRRECWKMKMQRQMARWLRVR